MEKLQFLRLFLFDIFAIINPMKKKSVRLDKGIIPERYNLTLKPDLEAFVFSGKEIIDITLASSKQSITLHSKDIDIETAEIISGKESMFSIKISYDTKAETATLHFGKKIKKGKVKLSLSFSGIINESLRGFYRSKYSIDGKEHHLATTQFEATDARRAFPCFDEPAQKAVFDVSLVIPGDHTAISNTLPISIKEHEAGYKVVQFSPTPKMSTYLLAFIIGDFEYIEGYTKDKVQVRIFTTKGKKHQAKFALDVAMKSLEFYNKYFDIPYPLPILDMIAIPDFESGAMENWGAITYRETAILVDEEHSSLSSKQWIALVIAHELAHQWFGNLVTMHWWTDLWLNEGFASYIEYLAVDHIFPKWKIWDQFLTTDFSSALRLDSLKNSHPIEVEVHHPNEINEIFDSVSYSKGASIIRMLASYIGEENFKLGLRHYLKKHSYKNTQTTDLWDSFEKVSKKPVKNIMKSWTSKTGYPLLSIESKSKNYKVTQERFFSSRISRKNSKDKTLWQAPFSYQIGDKIKKEIIKNKELLLKDKNVSKLNKGEESLLRIKYDDKILGQLKTKIESGQMSTQDRLGIIRDLFALSEGGYIKTSVVLEFCESFKNETEYIVWAEIATGIDRISNLISDEKFIDKYNTYALSLFEPMIDKVGWKVKNGEDVSTTFLRSLILSHAGFYGDKKIVKDAQLKWKNRKIENINADIRSVVYNTVARNGDTILWEEIRKSYESTEMQEEKNRYLVALAQFKQKDLIKKTLTYLMSKNVRSQDAPHIINAVWANPQARDLVWKFVKENWDTILKTYGEGGHFLSRLLPRLGNHTNTKDAIDAKKFFKKNPAPGAERTLLQVYERIYSNSAWLASDKKDIQKWLEKNF